MNDRKPREFCPQGNDWPERPSSLDTSPGPGMQGESSLDYEDALKPGAPVEAIDQIYSRIFRELRPRTPLEKVSVMYRRFVNVNSSIRYRAGTLEVKLSDLLAGAPTPVKEALARILLGKLFRKPAAPAEVHRYRQYLNQKEIRRQIQLVRQIRGRKHISGPEGKVFNLADVFQRLNMKYFSGLLAQPDLGWSLGRSRSMLGHFDPSHNAIIISRVFDEPSVPDFALDYVMFHEMLHLQYPVDHSKSRRCVHTKEFREAERRFPNWKEAKEALKRLR